jgi:peroxiredoxin
LGKSSASLVVLAGLILFCPLRGSAQLAPDFSLEDLAGATHRLSDYRGDRVVLVNFWATWCVPCVKELPRLQALQDRYGAQGLQVLAISTDGPDRRAAVSSLTGRYGFTMPILLDARSEVIALYNPKLDLPYTVLVDRSGRVRYAHQGYSPGDERLLEKEIVSLLGEVEARPTPRVAARGSESFLLRLPRGDVDEGYSRIIDQVDLSLSSGRFLAGARLDTAVSFSPLHADVDLAKRFLEYSSSRVQARAGDFYASLGRGLVFSLTKVLEEEGLDYVIDTTVDGGRVAAAAGRFAAEAFGGWIDRPDDRSVRDKVVGGAIGWTPPGLGTIRFQGASAELGPGSAFGNRRVETGSVSVDLPSLWGAAEVYGEFSLVRRETYAGETPRGGHGLYLGSKLRAGRFSLLLELKDYRELDFEYGRPPLLESEELEILADQFDLDRTDITGAAARLDYFAAPSETLVYLRGLLARDDPDDHPVYGAYARRIGHVFGGIEKKFPGGGYLNALAGWRSESDTSVVFMSTDGGTFHDQVNASWPFGGGFSLEADWKHKVFDGPDYAYSEIRASLAVHKSPRWVAAVLFERSTDPAVVFATGRKNNLAGQLEVRFRGGHSLRLFVGATKGSVKCAGGVCRLFPPFKGVRLEGFFRF